MKRFAVVAMGAAMLAGAGNFGATARAQATEPAAAQAPAAAVRQPLLQLRRLPPPQRLRLRLPRHSTCRDKHTAAAPAVAAAPQGGTIKGTVKAGGVPLPGVAVTATNTLTGKKYATTTDIDGVFQMDVPRNGRYVVKTEVDRFCFRHPGSRGQRGQREWRPAASRRRSSRWTSPRASLRSRLPPLQRQLARTGVPTGRNSSGTTAGYRCRHLAPAAPAAVARQGRTHADSDRAGRRTTTDLTDATAGDAERRGATAHDGRHRVRRRCLSLGQRLHRRQRRSRARSTAWPDSARTICKTGFRACSSRASTTATSRRR